MNIEETYYKWVMLRCENCGQEVEASWHIKYRIKKKDIKRLEEELKKSCYCEHPLLPTP